MDKTDEAQRSPAPDTWQEALAQGEAEISAGLTSAWQEARERLLAELANLEADHTRHRA